MKWGDILLLTLLSLCQSVRPSVRPFVCLSVRHTIVSALYLLNPWRDFQNPLHKNQLWKVDVQRICLTKVGSFSRSKFEVKHCMTLLDVVLLNKHIPLSELVTAVYKNHAISCHIISHHHPSQLMHRSCNWIQTLHVYLGSIF